MGPKKKSDKKKGGKKSSLKKRDNGECLTFNEAVMIHQLEIKLNLISEIKDDIDDLKYRNERQKQRNTKLKSQQTLHVRDVIGQAREYENKMKMDKQFPYECVEKALWSKRYRARDFERTVEELQQVLSHVLAESDKHKITREMLKQFKENGQYSNDSFILLLKKEMDDMENSYKEMADFFEKSLLAIKASIVKRNEEDITKYKRLATEHALLNMDDKVEEEFSDNKWLVKEISIHKKSLKEVTDELDLLEKENIAIISELFERQLSDVEDKCNFFLHDGKDLLTKDEIVNQLELEVKRDLIEKSKQNMEQSQSNNWKWLDNYLPEFNSIQNLENFHIRHNKSNGTYTHGDFHINRYHDEKDCTMCDEKAGCLQRRTLYVVGRKAEKQFLNWMSPRTEIEFPKLVTMKW